MRSASSVKKPRLSRRTYPSYLNCLRLRRYSLERITCCTGTYITSRLSKETKRGPPLLIQVISTKQGKYELYRGSSLMKPFNIFVRTTRSGKSYSNKPIKKFSPSFKTMKGRTLVFDTETTGLPPRTKSYTESTAWESCRIVQIAWSIFRGSELEHKFCAIIKPDGFTIPPFVSKIHGITDAIAYEQGVSIHDVFAELQQDLADVSTVVAHNMKFDDNVLLSELHRYGKDDMVTEWQQKSKVCTMLMGCKHMQTKKWPKLIELYKHLSDNAAHDGLLHRADTDVALCAYCFFKMTT